MKSKSITPVALMALILSSNMVAAQDRVMPEIKHYGGKDFDIADLPEGDFKDELNALEGRAKSRALAQLRARIITDMDLNSLHVDQRSGGILYAESAEGAEQSGHDHYGSQIQFNVAPKVQFNPAYVDPLFDPSTAFNLHSNPGSANKIYLDFDGHELTGTIWNDITGSSTLKARAYSLDADYSSFSDDERRKIAVIWHQVAEDYAPFDVDVTTEQPETWGETMERILITESVDTEGNNMPYRGLVSGVSFLDKWGKDDWDTHGNPVYTGYFKNVLVYADYSLNIAGIVSHEMGHIVGLSHDGLDGSGYYNAPGQWSPIMGDGNYSNPVSQWSNGDYAGATQMEDDIAIIASKLGFRVDDHDSTGITPTPLFVNSSHQIVATNPENDYSNTVTANKGVIEKNGDVDYFSFRAEAETITITATPAWDAFYADLNKKGGNLDIKLTLLSLDGNVIAEVNPTGQTDATLKVAVAAGDYLLAVEADADTTVPYSDYGSLGQYFLSGSLVNLDPPNASNISVNTRGGAGKFATVSLLSGNSDADLTYQIISGPAHGGVTVSGSDAIYTPALKYAGSDSFTYSVTNAKGISATAKVSLNVLPNRAPVGKIGRRLENTPDKRTMFFSGVATDADGDAITYRWDFGDGTYALGAKQTHRYIWPGYYNVRLTVRDPSGAATSSVVRIYFGGCAVGVRGVTVVCPVVFTKVNTPLKIWLGNPAGLTYRLNKHGNRGRVAIKGNVATYTPYKGQKGGDAFYVTITWRDHNGRPKSTTMRVQLRVVP